MTTDKASYGSTDTGTPLKTFSSPTNSLVRWWVAFTVSHWVTSWTSLGMVSPTSVTVCHFRETGELYEDRLALANYPLSPFQPLHRVYRGFSLGLNRGQNSVHN